MVYLKWISIVGSILNPTTDLVDSRMKSREPILIVLFCDLEMSDWRDKMRQKILLQRPISWFIGPVFTLPQRIRTADGQSFQKWMEGDAGRRRIKSVPRALLLLTASIIAHVCVDIEFNLGNGLILIHQ